MVYGPAKSCGVTWGMERIMRKLVLGLAFLAAMAVPGWAQTPEEMIVASLEEQGYHVVTRDRTWLGRIWLLVENGEVRREIVFNPGTGEIMRDYAVMIAVTERDSSRSPSTVTTALSASSSKGAVGSSVLPEVMTIQGDSPTVTEPALILPAESP